LGNGELKITVLKSPIVSQTITANIKSI
jgi:hypothetical protein